MGCSEPKEKNEHINISKNKEENNGKKEKKNEEIKFSKQSKKKIIEEPEKNINKENITKNIKKESKKNILLIDPNFANLENSEEKISKLNSFGIQIFKNINMAINYLKTIKSNTVKVIINEEVYSQFIQTYQENIVDMCFILTIIIHKKQENENLNINNDTKYKNNEHNFYEFGGTINKIDELKTVLKKANSIEPEIKKKNLFNIEVQFTFEFIDSKEKLLLPLSFKSLIEKSSNDNMKQYTNSIFNIYCKDNIQIKLLLNSLITLPNITIEKLAKYYARLYSIESGFYRDINESLRLNKAEKYLPFIKTLYEGVKLKILPLASDNILYRGSKISKVEIDKIKNYLNKKIENLPGLIVFSKPFLSFSKERDVAFDFLKFSNCDNNLAKVLFVLEKDDNVGFNLSTHCDLENLSYYEYEKEVLFFPFSSFEIKEIKEITISEEKGYEMRLLYLGKYLKDIENDKDMIIDANTIPDSEFKKQLAECGLIKKEKIEQLNSKSLIQEFKKYEEDINKNINNNENYINNNVKMDDKNIAIKEENSIIMGEIYVGTNEKNKSIQIINSFENFHKVNNIEYSENDNNYCNENDIKENIEIKIEGKKIDFSYSYKFEDEGEYKIEYLIKKNLTKTNNMFSDCKYLTSLNLSNFNTQNVKNMSYMFYNCEHLINLDLSNFDTHNVNNMNHMFFNCNSLKKLDLSFFNIKKVSYMKNILSSCDSLVDLNAPFKYH